MSNELEEIMDFDDFKIMLEKKKTTQYSAGCVMGYFENDFNNPKIKESDIYDNEENEFGLEVEPHVTVLYGLDDKKTDEEELVKLFTMLDGPVCSTTQISLFENPDFDVVKWDIEQPELVILNRMLTSMYPYKTDHPDYHAHVTIAFCLPGEGKKYTKKFKGAKKQKIAYWVYSQADGRKIKITPGKGMTIIRKKYDK